MILCKYTKLDRAVYFGHLDVLRIFGMAIRRKAIPVEYSQGFNKHILLFMSQPLSLGIASECEYFCVHSDCDPPEFMNKMNSSLPDGIRIVNAKYVSENPNISGLMRAAEYEVAIDYEDPDKKISDLLNKSVLEIETVSKNEKTIRDIKPLIYSFDIKGNILSFKIACGNLNLKADKLVNYIIGESKTKFKGFITKKHLYTTENGIFVDIDEYFK